MLFILVFIIWLVICVMIAKKFESIVVMKGYSEEEAKGYFWWCFWLEAVGWMMVIALPDKKSQECLLRLSQNMQLGNKNANVEEDISNYLPEL